MRSWLGFNKPARPSNPF